LPNSCGRTRSKASSASRWPLLACVRLFLLVFEELGPDAKCPGPILVPHQCRQDSGAHYAAGDKPGGRGVSGGYGGDQTCGRAGKDRGDRGEHSGDRPVDQPAASAKALDGKPPRWRDAGQVMSELWRVVEVVSPKPRDPFYVLKPGRGCGVSAVPVLRSPQDLHTLCTVDAPGWEITAYLTCSSWCAGWFGAWWSLVAPWVMRAVATAGRLGEA
jgi:hypothetical protein